MSNVSSRINIPPTNNAPVSMASIVSAAIHRPEVGGVPLYPHIDGTKAENRDPKWIAKSKTTFNSPTNIKALCITANGVRGLYWRKDVRGGQRGYDRFSADYMPQGEPFSFTRDTRLTATARPFAFLTQPYVLSNLEELWVDPIIFGGGFQVPFSFAQGQAVGDAKMTLYGLLGADAAKFPLLRTIVVFKGGDGSFPYRGATSSPIAEMEKESGVLRRRVVTENLEFMRLCAAQKQASYYINVNLSADIRKFEVRDYVFDHQYLAPFRDGLLNKYSGAAIKVTPKPSSEPAATAVPQKTVSPSSTVSRLETALDGLSAQGYTSKQIAVSVMAYAKDDAIGVKEEYSRFSIEGRRKYGAFIEKAVGK